MRQLVYLPLVAAVAAGALCTGAGISTAADATTATAPAVTDTPQSGDAYNWYLLNHTGQPIYGSWEAKMSSGDHSEVKTDKDHPWKPDDAAKATQYENTGYLTKWMGHICFNNHMWAYGAEGYFPLSELVFRLEVDSAGTPWTTLESYYLGIHHTERKVMVVGSSC
ncbi:hypothetical protein R3Q06_27505 [Rhodococcus erythropolis]|uniref:hypothetical protein n=1 Tax=Rhodococcus erythropolis TaxID=1833 RepID=UPI002949E584|nr:hypothetical protein [Rhodococcus erythropolis]MDV6277247.1 hypothetical protein [Rhodococcus erythropolis]